MEAVFGALWLPCLICFIIGMVLLILELCLPGFGLAGCTGVLCFIAVIVMQFSTNNSTTATIVSAVMAAIILLLVAMFVRSMSRGLLFRSPIVLRERIEAGASLNTSETPSLLGKQGVVLTTLRPSGTILIDGKRYTAKTQARFIEKGENVTVIASDGLDWIVE